MLINSQNFTPTNTCAISSRMQASGERRRVLHIVLFLVGCKHQASEGVFYIAAAVMPIH